jgi:hypothetical protein
MATLTIPFLALFQISDLVQEFDVWVLSIPADDRSSLSKVVHAVIRHLEGREEERR